MDELAPAGLSIAAWSLSNISHYCPRFMEAVRAQVLQDTSRFDVLSLCNLGLAFANMVHPAPDLAKVRVAQRGAEVACSELVAQWAFEQLTASAPGGSGGALAIQTALFMR